MNEDTARIIKAAITGAAKGGPAGAALSLLTGAAVVATIPAWVPFVGAGAVISAGAVGTWAAVGAAIGAVTGGAAEGLAISAEDNEFNDQFKL